jgi:tetratricopeptide (TPR) repeat protein
VAGKTRKEQIKELLAEDPNDPFLRYALAMEFVSEGAEEEALQCFQGIFRVAEDYVPAYQQAGQVLLRLGRPAEAAEVLRRGITAAARTGERHALEEMQAMLATMG